MFVSTSALLIIEHLNKEYVKGKPVLNDINLTIEDVGITAIIGPSGIGKSTLLRCINRLVEPTKGRVLIRGNDITGLSGSALRKVRREIGMIFQEFNLVDRLSVMENALCGRLGYVSVRKAWLRKFPRKDIDAAFDLLDVVGLGEFATVRADNLSGGQRQRVGIARALMQQPQILLADEPTASLDPKTSVEIMELLRDVVEKRGVPVLVNMHDVTLAKRFATRMIGMSSGGIIFDGPPAELQDDHLRAIYGGKDWLQ
jgi:phosphonate transport system ATP-binding protein